MKRVGAATLAILLIGSTIALADAPEGSSRSERRLHDAGELVDKASRQVERNRACRPRPNDAPATDASPSAALQGTLAPLRRPQQPTDLQALAASSPVALFPGVYRRYARVVTAAEGTVFTIVALRNANFFERRPQRCVAELRARLGRALAGRRSAFKRVARDQLERRIRDHWLPSSQEGIAVGTTTSGGSMTTLSAFRTRGFFMSTGSIDTPGATFYGVVPDGVATVDFTFRARYRATATVRDNVLVLRVPLRMRDAALVKQVWRAADGSVIRTVRD